MNKVNKAKLISLMFSAILFAAFNTSASAQESAAAALSSVSVSLLDSTKEQDGLTGPVRRVRTEASRLSNKSGQVIEGPRALLETTTYDLKGNRVENAYFLTQTDKNEGNAPTGNEVYKHDDKGNITEMTLRASDGSILNKENYTYEFDSVGNWTKMVTALTVFEGGKLKQEPIEVTYRTITYYFNQAIAKIAEESASTPSSGAPGPVLPAPAKSGDVTPTLGESSNTDHLIERSKAVLVSNATEAADHNAASTPRLSAENTGAADPLQTPALLNKLTGEPPASVSKTPSVVIDEKAADSGHNTNTGSASGTRSATGTGPLPTGPQHNDTKRITDNAGGSAVTKAGERELKPSAPGPVTARRPIAGLVSGKVVNDRVIKLPKPDYPEAAKRMGVSGTVSVEVLVNSEGQVTSAHYRSGQHLFEAAALRAARLAVFSPAANHNQPTIPFIINYIFSKEP